jgi:hypothetical protein
MSRWRRTILSDIEGVPSYRALFWKYSQDKEASWQEEVFVNASTYGKAITIIKKEMSLKDKDIVSVERYS